MPGVIGGGPTDYYVATNAAKDRINIFRSTTQGASWSFMTFFAGGSTHPSLFFPTLASDGPDRLGLAFLWTNAADTYVQAMFAGAKAAATNVWDPPYPLSGSVRRPQTSGYCGGNGGCPLSYHAFGDYLTIATAPYQAGTNARTYFPAWTSWNPVNGLSSQKSREPYERVEFEGVTVEWP